MSAHFCAYSVRVQWTPAEIKKRRLAKGLNQDELAAALGLSRRAITNWETGTAEPRGSSLRALERELGDDRAPQVTLRDATVMELLAEIASRFARLEAANIPPTATDAPERVKWYTPETPTAARRGDADQPEQKGTQTL